MIDQNLLEILVCPETKQPLRVADVGLLEKVNDLISAGSVTNRGGEPVTVQISGALIREDGDVLHPVRSDITLSL